MLAVDCKKRLFQKPFFIYLIRSHTTNGFRSSYLKCQVDKLSECDCADFSSLTGDFSKMPPVSPVNLWPFVISLLDRWKYRPFLHANAFCSKRILSLAPFEIDHWWESDGELHQLLTVSFGVYNLAGNIVDKEWCHTGIVHPGNPMLIGLKKECLKRITCMSSCSRSLLSNK